MECLYVVSISFQVAGAVLLMIKAFFRKRENAIKKVFGYNLTELDNNTDEVIYDEEEFKDIVKQEYLTVFSVIYILVGYSIGIFGSIENSNKWLILFIIIIFTLFLIKITYFLVDYIYEKFPKINKKVTINELRKLGIKPNIENFSNKEIDEIIEKAESNIVDEN